MLSYANEIIQNSTALVHNKVNIKFLKSMFCYVSTALHKILHAYEGEDGLILYTLVSVPLFVIER
jgi:hypothetical protein